MVDPTPTEESLLVELRASHQAMDGRHVEEFWSTTLLLTHSGFFERGLAT